MIEALREKDGSFGGENSSRQIIRYSGTENKIRILVEHRDAEMVADWIGKFTEAVKVDIGVPV